MKKIKCMDNKGFTTADIIIAVIIIVLFVSILTTAFYNYYESIQSKNRRTMATSCIIDVIENVEMMDYDSVTISSVNNLINELKGNGTISSNYTVTATLQNYNETAGNESKKDLIKILNVKVEYIVNDKQENVEIKTLITK